MKNGGGDAILDFFDSFIHIIIVLLSMYGGGGVSLRFSKKTEFLDKSWKTIDIFPNRNEVLGE